MLTTYPLRIFLQVRYPIASNEHGPLSSLTIGIEDPIPRSCELISCIICPALPSFRQWSECVVFQDDCNFTTRGKLTDFFNRTSEIPESIEPALRTKEEIAIEALSLIGTTPEILRT